MTRPVGLDFVGRIERRPDSTSLARCRRAVDSETPAARATSVIVAMIADLPHHA
jgi:hypothetical protein